MLRKSGYRAAKLIKRFGDLMLLLEDGDTAAHMCVYIADDIVYTKNGGDLSQPWILMRIKDMMVLYSSDKPQSWHVFGRKTVASG